ncbi:hypothetical protein pfor_12c1419 [Rhodobacteraceae bacterium SB2]|nr:hypothetical protein pfor_12c1419 [Rhodobacteraceae bacterium SB2]
MLRLKLKNYLLSALLVMAPVFAVADEVTDVVNDVAAKLVQQLPMDKKIALKSLSPDETGLPEDFLRKLTSDLEAALLLKSEFEAKLINRLSTEELWQDAIEFGDADFDDLYEKSKADLLLLLMPRITANGLSLTASAYSLIGEEAGQLRASTGSINLNVNLDEYLGINVKTIESRVASIISKIQKISSAGGLIESPNDFADYYHNAKIYKERGENEYALANYEEAIKLEGIFYDPLNQYLELLVAKYGLKSAKVAYQKQVKSELSLQQVAFSDVYFSSRLIDYFPRNALDLENGTVNSQAYREPYFQNFNPPSYAMFLKKYGETLFEIIQNKDFNPFSSEGDDLQLTAALSARYLLMRASTEVLNAYQSGEFDRYFIDDLEGTLLVNPERAAQFLDAARSAVVFPVDFKHYYGSSGYKINRFDEIILDEKLLEASIPTIKDYGQFASIPCGYLSSNSTSIEGDHADWGSQNTFEVKFPDLEVEVRDAFKKLDETKFAIYADRCIDFLKKKNRISLQETIGWSAKVGDYETETGGVTLSAFNIAIYDDVDLDEPTIIHMNYPNISGECCTYYQLDITKDGTEFSRGLDWFYQYEDWQYKVLYPKIISTRGLVQSSVNYTLMEVYPSYITYFDKRGNFRKISLTKASDLSDTNSFSWGPPNSIDLMDINPKLLQRVVKKLRVEPEARLACGINEQTARISNVQNYTNFRQRAGLNQPVLGQISLGETVTLTNPGSYLRTDRCASICNGSNQQSIKQCIDNNEVWIEVRYRGRVGYLSRNFVE